MFNALLAKVFGTSNERAVKRMLPTLDKGMGTLIQDLAEKDLLKECMVMWAGEFGRTPDVNAGKGRDHWANGFSVVLAGGGLAGSGRRQSAWAEQIADREAVAAE